MNNTTPPLPDSYKLRRSTGNPIYATLALIFIALASYGQTTTVEIGTGAGTANNVPISAYYGYSYTQQVYLASEIGASGYIHTIRFYWEGGNMGNSTNWTVYVGYKTNGAFSSSTDWIPLSALTQIYSGDITAPSDSDSTIDIDLAAPFFYDATQGNLVIAVDENTPGYSSGNTYFLITTGSGRSISFRNDSNNPNPANPPTATVVNNYYNNIELDMTPPDTCTGQPAPGATITSNENICGSGAITLDLENNYTEYSGITYQWQISADSATGWENAGPSAGGYYYTDSIAATTWYRAVVACNSDSATSAPVKVKVHPLPGISLNADNIAYCDSSTAILIASGAGNYVWSPASGLNMDTGNTVEAAPEYPTVYVVTATDSFNCQNTDTVKVSPASLFSPEASATPAIICSNAVPVTISVNPATDGNGAGLEYELLDTSGNVIIPWQADTAFEFTPSVEGDLSYHILARPPGCAAVSDTGQTEIYYGFAADVTIKTPDCSGINDSIVITHPQGAGVTTQAWQNDFSSTMLPDGVTLYGNAAIIDGRAVITPSSGSNKGGLSIANIDTVNPQALEVSFDFTADQPINIFGTGGGDGLTWSFGDDADYTSSVTNGAGSKLRVVFDAANNGEQNGNARGIYLTYGYTGNTQMGPSSPGVLAYSPDISWKFQTDKPVRISIDQKSRLTLSYDGNIIFNQVQLPSGYTDADKSQWKHLFTAFTGGDALRHAIDNLNITYHYYNFVYGLSAGGTGNIPATWQQSGIFTNLAMPDSFDIWIASGDNPQSCNKLLGTYRFTHPITVSSSTYSELTSCNSDDGTITLVGLIPNLSYGVSFEQNSVINTGLTITADSTGNITIGSLPPGLYSNISVAIDGCTNDSVGDVTIPQPVKPDIIAFSSGSNTDCADPNGSITLFSPDFVSNTTYDIWYNGIQQPALNADANHLITIPGLSTGSYANIYVATPQACYSDTVLSQTVDGLEPAAVIAGVTGIEAGSCNTADGAILLSGNFNTGTSYITFKRNGIPDVMIAYPTATQIEMAGLLPGIYDSICVTGINTCASNTWGSITLSDNITTEELATGNATATAIQGAGVALQYADNNCELITTIHSVNDSLGNVTASVYLTGSTLLYNNEPYIGRYYDIKAGNNAGGSVTLYFTDAEINDYNTTVTANGNDAFPPVGPNGENLEITAYHSPVAGNGPQGYDTTGAETIVPSGIIHNIPDSIWAVSFNTGSFSGFFAHTYGSGTPLPVLLINVKATNSGPANRIDWSMSEPAKDYQYAIERSANGKTFEPIGVIGTDKSTSGQYSFVDANPFKGINFYRIRIGDQAGKIFYSEVVSAVVKDGTPRINVYPNPVEDALTVKISGDVNGQGDLWLTDALGRIINHANIHSNSTVRFNMQHLAQGVYILKYRDSSTAQSIKISKQ